MPRGSFRVSNCALSLDRASARAICCSTLRLQPASLLDLTPGPEVWTNSLARKLASGLPIHTLVRPRLGPPWAALESQCYEGGGEAVKDTLFPCRELADVVSWEQMAEDTNGCDAAGGCGGERLSQAELPSKGSHAQTDRELLCDGPAAPGAKGFCFSGRRRSSRSKGSSPG